MILFYVKTVSLFPVVGMSSRGSECVGAGRGACVLGTKLTEASRCLLPLPQCLCSVSHLSVSGSERMARGTSPFTLPAHGVSIGLLMEGRNEEMTWCRKIYILVFVMPPVWYVTLGSTLNIAGIHFLF